MCFVYLVLHIAPKGSCLILQNQAFGQPTCAKHIQWYSKFGNILLAEWHFHTDHHLCTMIFRAIAGTAQIPMQVLRTFPGRFILLVLQLSPSPIQACSTSFGTTSKARYMKRDLPILITSNSEFRSVFKGPVEKCYEFGNLFHHFVWKLLMGLVSRGCRVLVEYGGKGSI